VSELSDGAVQLADGAHQSAGGATELSEGVGTFADGTRQSADGAGTLAEGTRGLADGTGELADGTDQLADGSGELSDGTRELADGLQEGADEIPTYTESERETMSQMGAEPVTTNSVRENEASGASTATFPFVVALALWLGAFATFLLLPTLNPRLLQSAVPMWRVVLRSLLPSLLVGVVQAVAVLATLTFIGIEPVSALGVGLITLAGSVMFMALHQALVTLFGERVGRVLSIVLMVLQVVVLVGIVPVQSAPQLLQDVASFMPITILSQGLVHAALGGTLTHISSTLLAILTWFAVSVILTLVFSRGARTLRPSHGKLRTSSRKEPVAA
jgi:putative membrane protein